jgi:hypothetical protein
MTPVEDAQLLLPRSHSLQRLLQLLEALNEELRSRVG